MGPKIVIVVQAKNHSQKWDLSTWIRQKQCAAQSELFFKISVMDPQNWKCFPKLSSDRNRLWHNLGRFLKFFCCPTKFYNPNFAELQI